MAIPAGVICGWLGTAASIPAGWTRLVALDDRYPKGTAAATDPGTTGGAATHTHALNAAGGHRHNWGSHGHTVTGGASASPAFNADTGSTNPAPGHTHSCPDLAASTNSPVNAEATVVATDVGNNEPTFRRAIWIQSDGTPIGIPALAVTLWNGKTGAPASWTHLGASATPNLTDVYLRGALAAGDGGGTGGGISHSHGIASHHHPSSSHFHPASLAPATLAAMVAGTISGATSTIANSSHTHSLQWANAGLTMGNSTDTAGSSNYDPPYVYQSVIRNDAAAQNIPVGCICLWTGTLSTIPLNWNLCDGTNGTPDLRGKYIKCPSALAGIGVPGGAATHGHTATGHTHSIPSHTHGNIDTPNGQDIRTAGATAAADETHTHPWTVSSNTGTTAATAPTVTDSTIEPPYLTVAFIQYAGITIPPPGPGANIVGTATTTGTLAAKVRARTGTIGGQSALTGTLASAGLRRGGSAIGTSLCAGSLISTGSSTGPCGILEPI